MVLLPSDPELNSINFDKFILQVGSNPDTYTALVAVIPLRLKRARLRKTTTIGTAYYFTGAGMNEVTFILLMTSAEAQTFINNTNPLSSGQLVTQFFKLQSTDENAVTKTIGNALNTPTGFRAMLDDIQITSQENQGAVEIRCNGAILDEVVTMS